MYSGKRNLPLKYYSRLNLYKASNVTFNPVTLEAYSYKWWRFVAKINGFMVFNAHSYSVSTSKHQNKLRSLLRELGINIDLTVYTEKSLGEWHGKTILENAYYNLREKEHIKMIKTVFKVKLTQEEIQMIYDKKEENECDEYLNRALKYQEKKELKEKMRTDEEKRTIHDKQFHKTVMQVIQ